MSWHVQTDAVLADLAAEAKGSACFYELSFYSIPDIYSRNGANADEQHRFVFTGPTSSDGPSEV